MISGHKAQILILKFLKWRTRKKSSRRMLRAMARYPSKMALRQMELLRNQSGLFDYLKGIRVGEASNEGPPPRSARRNVTGGMGCVSRHLPPSGR